MHKFFAFLACIFFQFVGCMDSPEPQKSLVEQIRDAETLFSKAEEQFTRFSQDKAVGIGKVLNEQKEKEVRALRTQEIDAFTAFFMPAKTFLSAANQDGDSQEINHEDITNVASILGLQEPNKYHIAKLLYERSDLIMMDRINSIQGWLYPNSATLRFSLPTDLLTNMKKLRQLHDESYLFLPSISELTYSSHSESAVTPSASASTASSQSGSMVVAGSTRTNQQDSRAWWRRFLIFFNKK